MRTVWYKRDPNPRIQQGSSFAKTCLTVILSTVTGVVLAFKWARPDDPLIAKLFFSIVLMSLVIFPFMGLVYLLFICFPPFSHRALSGRRKSVENYLAKGRPVDVKLGAAQLSLLHVASVFNWLEVAERLLENGATISIDRCGITPLHVATSAEMVRLLVSAGADVHAEDHQVDIDVVLDFSADDPGKIGTDGWRIVSGGRRPLHFAAYFSNLDAAHELIEFGGQVNATDALGRTALHMARDPDACELLVSAGGNVDAKARLDLTPLHLAILRNDLLVVRKLLLLGASRENLMKVPLPEVDFDRPSLADSPTKDQLATRRRTAMEWQLAYEIIETASRVSLEDLACGKFEESVNFIWLRQYFELAARLPEAKYQGKLLVQETEMREAISLISS